MAMPIAVLARRGSGFAVPVPIKIKKKAVNRFS
jgi:hypothetical protein